MQPTMSVMVLGLRGFPGVQGGVENHAEHLYSALALAGCKVEVLVRSPYQPPTNPGIWQGMRFTRLWAPRRKSLEAIVHTFVGVLYAALKRPDILHIHAVGPALLTPLARLFGLHVVVTHHGPDYERQKWGRAARTVLRVGERLGMLFAHQRIAISQVISNMVAEKYGRASVLIPNGVALPRIPSSSTAQQAFGLSAGKYILLVSRLVPEKRHLDLIRAFELAALPGWKLVLVGASDHPDAYTQAVQAAAAGAHGVVCTGFQSGQPLRELYAHAGMFVLPSSHEGLPIALLEALSYGLPVIASDIPANLEVRHPGVDFYPVGDVGALAALLRVKSAETRDAARTAEIQERIAAAYCWTKIASETLCVYDTITRAMREAEPGAITGAASRWPD